MKNARTPIVVAGLLVVGFWLGNLFRGFGPGGPSTGPESERGRAPNRWPSPAIPTLNGSHSANRLTCRRSPRDRLTRQSACPPSGASAQPLTIVIDGAGYALLSDAGEAKVTSLEEIRTLAGATTGNDQGPRPGRPSKECPGRR